MEENRKGKNNINYVFPNPADIKNTQDTRFIGDDKYTAAALQVTVSQSTAKDSNETGTHRSLRKPKANFHAMMHVNWTKALRFLGICKKHQETRTKLKPQVHTFIQTYSKMKVKSKKTNGMQQQPPFLTNISKISPETPQHSWLEAEPTASSQLA